MSASDQADPAVAAAEAELARLRAEAEAAEAQLKAAQAKAALAAAEAAAAKARAARAPSRSPAAEASRPSRPRAGSVGADAGRGRTCPADAGRSAGRAHRPGPLDADQVAAIVTGYTFEGTTLDLGALVNGDPVAERADPHSARHDEPARARRRRHRHRQDPHAAGARRAARGQGRPGLRGRHQGRPLRRRDTGGVEREAAGAHHRRSGRTGSRRHPSPSTSPSAASARACRCARRCRASGRCC